MAADTCVLRVRCRHSLHPHPSAPSSHAFSCKPSRQHFCRLSSLSSSAPVSSSLGRSFLFLTLCAWHPSRPCGAPVQPVRAPGGNLERGWQSLSPPGHGLALGKGLMVVSSRCPAPAHWPATQMQPAGALEGESAGGRDLYRRLRLWSGHTGRHAGNKRVLMVPGGSHHSHLRGVCSRFCVSPEMKRQ